MLSALIERRYSAKRAVVTQTLSPCLNAVLLIHCPLVGVSGTASFGPDK
jgi:hypothetical protein